MPFVLHCVACGPPWQVLMNEGVVALYQDPAVLQFVQGSDPSGIDGVDYAGYPCRAYIVQQAEHRSVVLVLSVQELALSRV